MLELPDRIRQKTTRCAHDFGCLETGHCGDREMCKVVRSLGEDVLKLATREPASCAYRVGFGYGQLCTCPVRHYLHSIGYLARH